MPSTPNSPSSFIACLGKEWCLSHSAAKGARRSPANWRSESRIISCSWVKIIAVSPLYDFERHGGRFAAADAQAGNAALAAALAQGVDQRDDDARTRRTDRVTEGAGAAVHVHLVRRQAERVDGEQRDDREGFVDLEQVDIAHA